MTGAMNSPCLRPCPSCCAAMPRRWPTGRRSAKRSRGIWQTYTWAEYRRQVRDFALGLAAHGFRRGDKLAVIGDNRPRLYWAQLAAQCLGGIAVPVYQDAIATEMAYVLEPRRDHGRRRRGPGTGRQDPVLEGAAAAPRARRLRRSARPAAISDPSARTVRAGSGGGPRVRCIASGLCRGEIDQARPEDVALFSYTSGTTGRPKGVMLSHANLLSRGRGFCGCRGYPPDGRASCPICRWRGSASRCFRWS